MVHTHLKTLASAGLVFCLFSTVFAYSGGSGTEADPYQIGTVADWNDLMNTQSDWDATFIMTADINLQGVSLMSVGNYGEGFIGVFDGNSHIVRNAYINMPGSHHVGLFGFVDSGGQIRNLGAEDVNITGNTLVGGLVGDNLKGTITNCHATGIVSGIRHAGGLVGLNEGAIIACHATSEVTGSGVGDIYIGGLVGGNYNGTITACYAMGAVTGDDVNSDIGGLVGLNNGTISNCHATGTVNGGMHAGGLVGLNIDGTITDCYATGEVTGSGISDYYSDGLGGLVGTNQQGTISNCYATGVVRGKSCVGGLVGSTDGAVTNSYATGTVVGGKMPAGGLVGYNFKWIISSTISNCYATGMVSGELSVGGLVGINSEGDVTNCSAMGMVSGGVTGGLVGQNYGPITNCYAAGMVSGGVTGGLVGANIGSAITNCYATGMSIGEIYAGGLVGGNYYFSTITNCYATGTVSGGKSAGGLVEQNFGTITACFWDIETSGQTTSAGGTGLTTAEMMTLSTFTSAGWDFVNETANGPNDIWFIHEGIDYPKFVWQNRPPTADAGFDQVAYAWIDGVAEITLDGSGSYDADGDSLTYLWKWSIDGNTYDTNGINPTIELPVGEHSIELVVNDGFEDSEPNEVTITVVEPIEGSLQVVPRIINGRGGHQRITAILRLPTGIRRQQIDAGKKLLLYPGEIEASFQFIARYRERSEERVFILACFDASALIEAVGSAGPVQLDVVGQLKTGRYFYGSDTVRIVNPPRRPPWRWWYWSGGTTN